MKKIAWVVFPAVFACSGPQNQESSIKIFGGTRVQEGQWLNAVAIVDKNGMFCSGTAITPRLIVTAAHCVEGEKPKDMRVYVGSGVKGGDVKGQYKVVNAAYSPLYNPKKESDHDVGYLVLKNDLDLPADAYIPVATDPDEINELIAVGRPTHLVGFGDIENGSYGVKYETTTSITALEKTEITIGGDGKDACYGDSGGPAFGQLKTGEWRVYGVVSRGKDCGGGGIWGLIHANICWIQKDSGINLDLGKALCKG